jgi:undecaprenyl-diphosphatase
MSQGTAHDTAQRHASTADPMRGPVLVVFNPDARAAQGGVVDAAAIEWQLHRVGVDCAVVRAASEEEARHRTAAAAGTGTWRAVVAAGGDGTVHAVAEGLLIAQAASRAGDGVIQPAPARPAVLGILPLGTMNNLANSLGIPDDLAAACAVLARAEPRPLDIGQIDGRYVFLEEAGAGLEAALCPCAEALKGRILVDPRAAMEALRILRSFRPVRVALDLDGRRLRLRALQVSICNAPRYGMAFAAAPDARMDDGWLDVLVSERFSRWELVRHYVSIMGGRRDLRARIRRLRARCVSIAPIGTTWDVHADGQRVTHTPAVATILPGALRVLAPAPPGPDAPPRDEGGALGTLLRAATPPNAALAGETLVASTEQVRQALAGASDEARRAIGVEPPQRSARRAQVLRLGYLVALVWGIATTIAVRRTGILPGDLRFTRAVQRRRSRAWDRFWSAVAAPGFPRLSAPLVAVAAVTFWALRLRLEAAFTILASGTNVANWLVKRLVGRERPTRDMVHVARVINEPGFPSGHVMHYVSFYGFLAAAALANLRPSHLRRALVGACAALIGLVGPSRVYLGAHWPSDVAAGYLFGGLYLGGLLEAYARIKRRRARGSAPARHADVAPGD